MGYHTYDVSRADNLEDPTRHRYLSIEELYSYIEPEETDVVVDLGSGTGFYTDEIVPYVELVLALDIQSEMHRIYWDKGIPSNVHPITAGISSIPIKTGSVDTAFSTMTFHEFMSEDSLREIKRILVTDGVLVLVDWTSNGTGIEGPPLNHRYNLEEAIDNLIDAGFEVTYAVERTETFVVIAK